MINPIDPIISDTSSIPELITHNNFIYDKNKFLSIRQTESTHYDPKLENNECSICLENFDETSILYSGLICKHKFHSDCLNKWLLYNNTCPHCRIEIT